MRSRSYGLAGRYALVDNQARIGRKPDDIAAENGWISSVVRIGRNLRKEFLLNGLISILASGLLAAMPAGANSSHPRLAAYYDDFLVLCGNRVYAWSGDENPMPAMAGVRQVGVGRRNRYALTDGGLLLAWRNDAGDTREVMDRVSSFYAGRSGILAIRNDASLWQVESSGLFGFGEDIGAESVKLADNIVAAAVGDGANYYVTEKGALFVQGKAHRGQYGDGKLSSTSSYVQTARDVTQIVAHTGHALLLKQDGSVWGTGGNIYGPLSRHGYGDKASQWGLIVGGASAIATGSSHSLAIKSDASLWIWGRNEGLDPKQVMNGVDAVAAGNNTTLALSQGVLWQWDTGSRPGVKMKCE